VGTFGERLRREREMRGVTLDEIATATKIGTRSLKALEQEEFSKLPGGIFNKGFVRAYAKFLGIDEDQAVADYVAAAGAQEQSSDAVIEKLAAESERRAEEKRIQQQRDAERGPMLSWNLIAIVVVLAVAAVLGWQYYSRHQALKAQARPSAPAPVTPTASAPSAPQQPAQQATSVAPASQAPVNTRISAVAQVSDNGSKSAPTPTSTHTTGATSVQAKTAQKQTEQDTAATANPTAPEFVVTVKANRQSWLASQADGVSHTQRMLGPNTEATFHARTTLKLVIGNAGGVEISFNGKPLSFAGEENKSKTLVFTPEGLQQ
jgi:cytoskeleton protein RodZ